jgi:lysophospholipase L1-like esterase
MRRFIVLMLMLVFVLGGGGWYWTRQEAAAQPYIQTGPGDVYVALGDSLAAGFIVSDPQAAYVARIAQTLRQQKDIQVRNFAVPGETSRSMLQRQLPQALAFIKAQRAAGKRVSPITLDIGGNDANAVERASQETKRRTIQAIETNIDSALQQLVAATTDANGQRTADIAIMTYYNPFPGDASEQGSTAYWADQLNAAIVRAAKAHGVAVADIASPFEGGNVYRYTYAANGDVHANDAGHGVIAEQFLKALGYGQ